MIIYYIIIPIYLITNKFNIYIENHNIYKNINLYTEICMIKIKYKEKGFLKRAVNAADRILFGTTNNHVETVNTERLPVGLFPDPKLLANELDQLENRKINLDENRQMALNYLEDRLSGLTPNSDFLTNGSMAQVSDGVLSRGSKEEIKISNQIYNEQLQENKDREQALQSQGQIINEGEKLKIGKQGPVTINDTDQDKKGKTIVPNLSVVEEEENFKDDNQKDSIFNNPFVIITCFILIICLFSGGTLIFFKMKKNK